MWLDGEAGLTMHTPPRSALLTLPPQAFGAFMHHVPDDGHIFILYGPTMSLEGDKPGLSEAGTQVVLPPGGDDDPMLVRVPARAFPNCFFSRDPARTRRCPAVCCVDAGN